MVVEDSDSSERRKNEDGLDIFTEVSALIVIAAASHHLFCPVF